MDLLFSLEPKLAFGFWLATLGLCHVLIAPYATYIVMKQGEVEDVVRKLYFIWMIPLFGSIFLGLYALIWKRKPREGLIPAEETGIDWSGAAEEIQEQMGPEDAEDRDR
jgi:hypothetical protein